MNTALAFLKRPGLPGPFGALMDEYARAAEDFCRVIETVPPDLFERERESSDPDTRSLRALCTHAVGAAHRYADYILKARGKGDPGAFQLDPARMAGPMSVRPLLTEMLRYTEDVLDDFYEHPDRAESLTFQVRWGPTYDSEMILEHGIVHLLRHRRQVERWLSQTR